MVSDLCRQAECHLRPLAKKLSQHCETNAMICLGRPAETIISTAESLKADAIVLDVRPHSPWLRWLHHNTTDYVARHASCGVIVVSPRADGALSVASYNRLQVA